VNFGYSFRKFANAERIKWDEFMRWTISDWLWLKRMLFNK